MDTTQWITEWGPLGLGWLFFAAGAVWIAKFVAKNGPTFITALVTLTQAVDQLGKSIESMSSSISEMQKHQVLLEGKLEAIQKAVDALEARRSTGGDNQ